MSKKSAIKKLKKAFSNYSLQVSAMSGSAGTQGATAMLQILEYTEDKTAKVVRVSSALGQGKDIKEAQDDAVINAIENLGL